MVLELQELINNPWGSSIGEAQNPEKPELEKEKKALDQVCLSDPILTEANISFYLFYSCFYSTPPQPSVESKLT